MEEEEDPFEWCEGVVTCSYRDFFFVYLIKRGYSAVLNFDEKYLIQVGDFVECQASCKRGSINKSYFKARHCVTSYRKIAPLAEVTFGRRNDVLFAVMTTTAKVCGTSTYLGRTIAMLENDTFGMFIDLDGVISLRASEVKFEFKSRESPMDCYKSIFVPIRVIQYIDRPRERPRSVSRHRVRERSLSRCAPQLVNGFVGHDAGTHYWVWWEGCNHDVMLFKAHAVPGEQMIGRWISMLIEKERRGRFRVCKQVEIIDDLAESRIKNDVAEIRVDFIYSGHSDGESPVFHNQLVGNIVDCEEMVSNLVEGEKYRAWISRHKREGNVSRWRISPKQDFIHPLNLAKSASSSRLSRSRANSFRKVSSAELPESIGNQFKIPRNRDSSDSENDRINIDAAGYSDDDCEERELELQNEKNRTFEKCYKNQQCTTDSDRRIELDNLSDRRRRKIAEIKNSEVDSVHSDVSSSDKGCAYSKIPPSHNYNEISKENKKLKSLIKQFISSSKVRREMKICDKEAYEELEKFVL